MEQEFKVRWLVEAIKDWERVKREGYDGSSEFSSGLCAYFSRAYGCEMIGDAISDYCHINKLSTKWTDEYGGWAWPNYHATTPKQKATWKEHCNYRINFMKRMLDELNRLGYQP